MNGYATQFWCSMLILKSNISNLIFLKYVTVERVPTLHLTNQRIHSNILYKEADQSPTPDLDVIHLSIS